MSIVKSGKASLLFILTAILILTVASYDLGTVTIPCQPAYQQQSPINIISNNTLYREERYFRLLASNYTNLNSTWTIFPNEQTIGFQSKNGTDLGYALFLKNWSIYKFYLESIYFRYGSSHTIDGMKYDVEMELVHKIDSTYRTPGRYIQETADTFIISIFFTTAQGSNLNSSSVFFDDNNLATFAQKLNDRNVYFKKIVKLNQIVQQSPGYFYQGTTTSNLCDPAWRLIIPKFQLISQSDANLLQTALLNLGYIIPNSPTSKNVRTIQPINSGVEIYNNDEDSTTLAITATTLQYEFNLRIKLDYLAILIFSILVLFW